VSAAVAAVRLGVKWRPPRLPESLSPAMAEGESPWIPRHEFAGHHRELHRHGDKAGWWDQTGLDPIGAARALWLTTHPRAQPVT
jgi:hypothetical protein